MRIGISYKIDCLHNHYLHEKLAAFVIPARDAGIQKKRRMDPSGLCCIATYERLTIVRIISNLLKILFFCNQSDQI
ncbi:hypothetical protein [Wolbachia endosymbiont (group A) of Alloplasta piceator]|uniref:hypothetical protein n=1 Tax=Wolbachia endosymbiont (group A) of Alloplasta piceator TaxID=3066188 RepID=UPI003340E8DD